MSFAESGNFGKSPSNNSNGKPLAMSKERNRYFLLIVYS